jgi:hypothetical protein
VRFVLFLVALGGGYGIAHALGAPEGWAAASGWAAAIAGWVALRFVSRRRGYRAAFRVERYRAMAEQLRAEDRETYSQILAQATNTEAQAAAQRDPDAFVALFLAEAASSGKAHDHELGRMDAP